MISEIEVDLLPIIYKRMANEPIRLLKVTGTSLNSIFLQNNFRILDNFIPCI